MTARSVALTAEMNVTPMLDILLVLLVTFIAAIPIRQTIDVQLPEQCGVGCGDTSSPIILEVLRDGGYRLNQQRVEAGALAATLRDVYDTRPDKILYIAGDRTAPYQAILGAMDVARGSGVRVLAHRAQDP